MQDANAASARNNRCDRKTQPLRVQENMLRVLKKDATCFEKTCYGIYGKHAARETQPWLRLVTRHTSQRKMNLASTLQLFIF